MISEVSNFLGSIGWRIPADGQCARFGIDLGKNGEIYEGPYYGSYRTGDRIIVKQNSDDNYSVTFQKSRAFIAVQGASNWEVGTTENGVPESLLVETIQKLMGR